MAKEKSKKITEIIDLPGVGPGTADKLSEAGFYDLMSVATSSPGQIIDVASIGESAAKKIINAARNNLDMEFISGKKLTEARDKIMKLSTGSKEIDELVSGGFETGTLTGTYGSEGSAKTALAYQLAVNTFKPVEEGGLDGEVVWIDSEKSFVPDRIEEISGYAGLDPEKCLENIHYMRVYSSDHQMLAVDKVKDLIRDGSNIKLIIIDSITSLFRIDYCLERGTKVYTIDGYKNIEDITTKDKVLTHLGKFKKVNRTFARKESEILNINIEGRPALRCTPEHPLFVLKENGQYKWVEARDLNKGDKLVWIYDNNVTLKETINLEDYLKNYKKEDGKLFNGEKPRLKEYEKSKELRKRGFSLEKISNLINVPASTISQWVNNKYNPKNKNFSVLPCKVKIDENFMDLIGLWLAEGTIGEHQVAFCYGYKEDYLAKRTQELIKKVFGLESTISLYGSSLRVTISSNLLKELFENLFDKTQFKRRIPDFIMELPPRLQEHILCNYFVGDGYNRKSETSLCTISPILAHQLMVIGARCGECFSLKIERRSEKNPNTRDVFNLRLMNNCEFKQGKILFKIKNIKKEPIMNSVFNLEVEEDNSFMANGIINHNCGRGELAPRQQKLNKHLSILMKMADIYNICVYVTNQVMAKPDSFFGDPKTPIGGFVLSHNLKTIIYLRRGKKGTRVAKLVDSPFLPDGECVFKVTERGIEDVSITTS